MKVAQTSSLRLGGRSRLEACATFHAHGEAHDLLVEEIAAQSGIDRDGGGVDSAAALAEQKHCGVRDFLRAEVALTEREFFRVEVAFQIAGDTCRGARLERTRTHHVETHFAVIAERLGKKP